MILMMYSLEANDRLFSFQYQWIPFRYLIQELTDLTADVRHSAEAACSVLATDGLFSSTSVRLGVELLLRLVNTLTWTYR